MCDRTRTLDSLEKVKHARASNLYMIYACKTYSLNVVVVWFFVWVFFVVVFVCIFIGIASIAYINVFKT